MLLSTLFPSAKNHQKVALVVLSSSACAMPSGANSVSCWPCQRLAKFHVVVPCRPPSFFKLPVGSRLVLVDHDSSPFSEVQRSDTSKFYTIWGNPMLKWLIHMIHFVGVKRNIIMTWINTKRSFLKYIWVKVPVETTDWRRTKHLSK